MRFVLLLLLTTPALAQPEGAATHTPDDLEWAEIVPGLEFGAVYGDWQAEAHAKLIRFAGDLVSPMHTHTHPYHGVVVQGLVINPYDDDGDPEIMGPGTHFYVPGGVPHRTGCVSAEPCLFYTHADGGWDIEMTEGYPPEPPYEVETDSGAMTVARTREILEAYAANHDPQYLAEDAVFIDTATGQRHEGREAIGEMLNHVYHVAFDARAEDPRLIVGEGTAALEATFVGTHIGEFAGIPATNREVRVPLSVLYEVGPEGITEGRIYMQAAVMMQQLGAVEATAEH